ncbi:hypothetical protein HDG34_003336 [Paraburkholderia sp. HC6.4b]|uniref:hypothetical protein n=1 Tax=unclassified Paraburkholderia TaxID=2615204 RepID=UPI001612396F|nr:MULTISPECIES: hypothetical protein [unclassified Paraburkholderia]MBB5409395.1 hypothetical protein [Paraburkholderia sp. HC6.4b]MBB5451124.1 hypothetical protein [Paraburkholderia sp. Kb1A]
MLQIACEDVDFQSDAFFRELAALFRELEGVKPDAIADHDAAMQLPVLIAHYTGMNVKVAWMEDGPVVYPPAVNKNHVLLSRWGDYFRQHMLTNADADKLIAQSQVRPIGRVDRRNARVSGVFSDLQSVLIVPPQLFQKKLSAEEIAAIVLHELGHVFAYFELISHTLTTNQILAGLSKKLDQSASVKDREAVLAKVKSVSHLQDLDVEMLAKSADRKVIEIVVVSSIARELQSEIGMPLFDMNGFEALADQFAVRLGAGRDLVTGLDKLNRIDGHIAYRNRLAWLYAESLKMILLLAVPLTLGGTWSMLMASCTADSKGAETEAYGTLKTRYERIREQLVEGMKDPKLSKEMQADYAEDIAAIDEVLATVSNRRQLFSYMADFLSSSRRQRISQEKLQRELESIANNDLFVKAAALRQTGI